MIFSFYKPSLRSIRLTALALFDMTTFIVIYLTYGNRS